MQLTELRQDDIVIIAVTGRLDAMTAPQLTAQLTAALARGDRKFVIDCHALEYLSSGGLRAFFAFGQQLPADGGLAFAAPEANVRKVMAMVELDRDFAVVADTAAAISALRAPGGQ